MAFEREIRDFEIIERWTTVRMHRRGSLGAHCHRVAIYAWQIADVLGYPQVPRGDLLWYALWHDAEEIFMGDLPGPFKRKMPAGSFDRIKADYLHERFPDLVFHVDDQIKQIVKVADVLDEVLQLADDMRMGNELVRGIRNETESRLFHHISDLDFPESDVHQLNKTIINVIGKHDTMASKGSL